LASWHFAELQSIAIVAACTDLEEPRSGPGLRKDVRVDEQANAVHREHNGDEAQYNPSDGASGVQPDDGLPLGRDRIERTAIRRTILNVDD